MLICFSFGKDDLVDQAEADVIFVLLLKIVVRFECLVLCIWYLVLFSFIQFTPKKKFSHFFFKLHSVCLVCMYVQEDPFIIDPYPVYDYSNR